MDQDDLFTQAGELERISRSSIAAPYNDHRLTTVEHTIAGCAIADPSAYQLLFARKSEFLGGSAGGQDDGTTIIGLSFGDDFLDLTFQVYRKDFSQLGLCPKSLCPLFHLVAQNEAVDPFIETWIVVDLEGHRHLSARSQFFQKQSIQTGSCAVQSCRITTGASPDNDNIIDVFHVRSSFFQDSFLEYSIPGRH